MAEDADRKIAEEAAESARGSIVAAAGCGKTEQIARATSLGNGRRLILTHTHAGVDVLRARLAFHKVPRSRYRLETIAGFCLRYAAAFPVTSGLKTSSPASDAEWRDVYKAASQLIINQAADEILKASYSGVFVDEYQDCSLAQHDVVNALSRVLPVCVFGDPLQAIFDFKGQQPVDWDKDVFPVFPKKGELLTPWRWHKKENPKFAEWLAMVRVALDAGGHVDLAGRPPCVNWEALPTDQNRRTMKIVEVCKRVRGEAGNGSVVVIVDASSIGIQAYIAKQLSKTGYSKIEPVGCESLYASVKKLEKAKDFKQLQETVSFITDCMTGAEETPYLAAVNARLEGRRAGAAKFGDLIDLGVAFLANPTFQNRLALLDAFHQREECYCFRREMFHAMRAAHLLCISRPGLALADAVRETQTRARHAGRVVPRLSVGSTLLVKGLEFDHAVVVHTPKMTRRDWYVALTRATTGLTVLSPTQKFEPAA